MTSFQLSDITVNKSVNQVNSDIISGVISGSGSAPSASLVTCLIASSQSITTSAIIVTLATPATITLPSSGTSYRVFATWNINFSRPGIDFPGTTFVGWVTDNAGANSFATGTTSVSTGDTQPSGFSGSGFTLITYDAGSSVTFRLNLIATSNGPANVSSGTIGSGLAPFLQLTAVPA